MTDFSQTRRLLVGGTVEDWGEYRYMFPGVSLVDIATLCYYYSHCEKMKRYVEENYGDLVAKDLYQVYNLRRMFGFEERRFEISINETYPYKVAGVEFQTAVKGLNNLEFETVADLLEFYTEYE